MSPALACKKHFAVDVQHQSVIHLPSSCHRLPGIQLQHLCGSCTSLYRVCPNCVCPLYACLTCVHLVGLGCAAANLPPGYALDISVQEYECLCRLESHTGVAHHTVCHAKGNSSAICDCNRNSDTVYHAEDSLNSISI